MTRRAGAVAIGLGAALPTAGCGVFDAAAGNTTPTTMTVSSGAFTDSKMPARYTCTAGAKAISPPLGWAGAPSNTKSLALVVDDSDAPITPYVYWIVFDISPATSEIPQGQLPPGALQARNSVGAIGYDPPCPGPQGHTYRFTVYALDKVLNLPEGTSLESAWTAIAAARIGEGRLPVAATTEMSSVSGTLNASATPTASP